MMREILKVLKRDPLTNYISKLYHIKLIHVLISYPFHSTSTINYNLKQLIIFFSFMHLWKNYIIIRVKCYQKKVQKYAARNVQNIFQTNISDYLTLDKLFEYCWVLLIYSFDYLLSYFIGGNFVRLCLNL